MFTGGQPPNASDNSNGCVCVVSWQHHKDASVSWSGLDRLISNQLAR
jgi:hypothetical protein